MLGDGGGGKSSRIVLLERLFDIDVESGGGGGGGGGGGKWMFTSLSSMSLSLTKKLGDGSL